MVATERRLRVCIVTRVTRVHGVGGLQDHVEDLAEGLARAGHHPVVITSRHPDRTPAETTHGVTTHYVDAPGTSFTDPAWRKESLATFARLASEHPFDVIHGHGSSALELVRARVGKETPVVVTFHGNFRSILGASVRRQRSASCLRDVLREQRGIARLARSHYALGNWWRFRDCEAIVPAREQLDPTCRSHHLDGKRVHVVPNGVDLERFRPGHADARPSLDCPPGPLFVFAGRLNRAKGIEDAIRGLAWTRDQGLSASLVVLGDGEDRERLGRLVSELGVGAHVRFAGAVGRDTVARFLGAADAFVFPSRHNEAAPLAVRQAMAAGLPVIASRMGSIPELVADCGILVAPGDARAFGAAMASLAGDPARGAELGATARRIAVANYGIDLQIARTIDVYRTARRARNLE